MSDWVMVPRVMTDAMRKVFHDRVRILVTPAKRECEITNDQELWELVLAATPKAPATDAGEKVWRLARFMGEQTEREAVVDWLKSVGDSKPHGTDWRTYYEVAEAIEEGRHEGDTTPTPTQEVSADDVVSRDSERALLSGHDGDLGKDDRGSGRGLARKEPLCDTCNDTGAIGYLPDDYQSCPDCNSDDSNPTDGTDPASALATPKAPATDAGEGMARHALELARPIVEADLSTAEEYNDADWEGMSRTALEAIDVALATPPAPNDDLRAAAVDAVLRVRWGDDAQKIRDYGGFYLERATEIADAVLALKENRRG